MKKMNFTTFLKMALVLVASFIGVMTAGAQEKLDIYLSDPTACSTYLTAAQLGGTVGDSFTVRKVGLELPISGVAQPDPTKSYFVKLFRFNKGDGDARGAASVLTAGDAPATVANFLANLPTAAIATASLGQASNAVGQEYLA